MWRSADFRARRALSAVSVSLLLATGLTGQARRPEALSGEVSRLVRAGRLTEAAPLERQKSELGQRYMTIAARIKASKSCLAAISPDQLETLRRKHDLFHALLQINLTVLATAHAVSEGIIRGVSDELARKAAPQTYGATGRPIAPPPSASQPLTLSRVL